MKGRKKMFKDKKLVNFWIEKEIWEEFKKISFQKGLNASSAIRMYIIEKVKNEKD